MLKQKKENLRSKNLFEITVPRYVCVYVCYFKASLIKIDNIRKQSCKTEQTNNLEACIKVFIFFFCPTFSSQASADNCGMRNVKEAG